MPVEVVAGFGDVDGVALVVARAVADVGDEIGGGLGVALVADFLEEVLNKN